MKNLFLILLLFFSGIIDVYAGIASAMTIQLSAKQSDGTLVHDLVTSLGITNFSHITISLTDQNTGETVTEKSNGLIASQSFVSNTPYRTKLVLNATAFSRWSVGDIMTLTITVTNPASLLNGVSASITFTKGPGAENFTNMNTPSTGIVFEIPTFLGSALDQTACLDLTEKPETAAIIKVSDSNTVERELVAITTAIAEKENIAAILAARVHTQKASLKDLVSRSVHDNKLIYETLMCVGTPNMIME